jgi:hypothetical protein
MSTAEIAHRARDASLKHVLRYRAGSTSVPPVIGAVASAVRVRLPDAADSMVSPGARQALIEAAELLLGGEWSIFGLPVRGFDKGLDWFRDPQTGIRGCDQCYCFDVPYRDERKVGNINCLWQVSRHHHLTVLAAAYRLSKADKFAERAAEQLRSWWAANPFLMGVHWSSGIEIGIRLISWVWIRRLLAGWPGSEALFEQNPAFIAQLFHHQEFLSLFQSHGSSANNHRIAEAAGLFAASTAFPLFAHSRRWQQVAARVLEQEIVRQSDGQGLNRELATDYHAFVLELMLAAAVEGDAEHTPLSESFWRHLQSMMDALAALVDCQGRPPRQGDSDDGTGLLLDEPGYGRWTSLLATGARLFGSLPWWGKIEAGDVRTAFLTSLARKRRGLGERPATRPAVFDEAGLVILRDEGPGQPELWCRCDHGPHGFLSIAAHAHADALAIELRHGGIDILADPGTYCYHGEPQWRRYFRSTLAHNTLELGGMDQAVSGGPFLWLTHPVARATAITGTNGGPTAVWRACHDGYLRSLGAIHHRSVKLERGERRIIIEDWVQTARSQDVRLAFHLGPSVACEHRGCLTLLEWEVDGCKFAGQLVLPNELVWAVHRGDDLAGWYSHRFAQKEPSASLVGSGRLTASVRLITVFQFVEVLGEAELGYAGL